MNLPGRLNLRLNFAVSHDCAKMRTSDVSTAAVVIFLGTKSTGRAASVPRTLHTTWPSSSTESSQDDLLGRWRKVGMIAGFMQNTVLGVVLRCCGLRNRLRICGL